MIASEFSTWLVGIWIALALITFVALHFLSAPYGRHARPGWGPTIPRTAGWILMELPALLGVPLLFFVSDRIGNIVAVIFVVLWVSHYANRTLIYPFRLRGGELRMPLAIMGMGFAFNLANGCLQGYGNFFLGPTRSIEWLADPRFLLGVALFVFGYGLNYQSDAILRNLRKPGESGYRIPQKGWYRFVSCPNYLGEIIEWLGWAMLTWSMAGLLFFLWTVANLVPRARTHHRWYQAKFPDYPKTRKAVLPFLY